MARKVPAGPHAQVAERFAFLLDALDLDRDGFVAAVDGAVTARSLFAILAGDRRPSRSLAVLIERTFGFRAEHLLEGRGPMWATADEAAQLDGLTASERRLVDFARRSVANARLLDEELTRAEAWEAMWSRAMGLLTDLEHLARRDDPSGYPDAATAALDECWRMADAFRAWTAAMDQRRVLHLTQLFVQRFLVQVPAELHARGALDADDAEAVRARAEALLSSLSEDDEILTSEITRAGQRITALTSEPAPLATTADLAADLDRLANRIERLRPLPV